MLSLLSVELLYSNVSFPPLSLDFMDLKKSNRSFSGTDSRLLLSSEFIIVQKFQGFAFFCLRSLVIFSF